MARPLRISFNDAFYHIMARGNRKDNIFTHDRDKYVFVEKMNETFDKYSFVCYAYCLMNNHYHLFIKTPFANISDGMHYLNTSYANWFGAKYNITGSIFQGRYKSILVDADSYALQLSAYIHLNPLRAGIVEHIYDYAFSSFLDYALKREPVVKNLDMSLILGKLDDDKYKASGKYINFVTGGNFEYIQKHRGNILGDGLFVEKIKQKAKVANDRELPAAKKLSKPKADFVLDIIKDVLRVKSDDIFAKKRNNEYRKMAMYMLKKHTSLSIKEVGEMFHADYSAVSQAVLRFEKKLKKIKIMRKKKLRISKKR